MMKYIFLFFYVTLNIFALEVLHSESLPVNTKVLLESISKHAIVLGKGSLHNRYIFVDPMCPHSQKYIKKITQNKQALAANTYYIFLYKLPKFDSNKLSSTIYESKNPLETLQKVMIEKKKVITKSSVKKNKEKAIGDKISAIAKVAKELKIVIRPYIIEFEKGSRYCLVSYGKAPCMEEFDF